MKRSIHARRPSRTLLSVALATCLVAVVPNAFAQSTGGSLRGQVSTAAGPQPNATVTAINLDTGLVRSVTANGVGVYTLAGLPPGRYRIDAEAGGQKVSRTVVVQVAQQAQ